MTQELTVVVMRSTVNKAAPSRGASLSGGTRSASLRATQTQARRSCPPTPGPRSLRHRWKTAAIRKALEEATSLFAMTTPSGGTDAVAANLPGVHGMSPSGPGAVRRKSHGKIALRVA